DRLAGVGGAQLRERAAGADHAVPDQQRAVLGQRGRRVPGERVAGRIDDGRGVDRHDATVTAARSPTVDSSAAATATAITAGSLLVIPRWPIGQVIRAISSG